MTTSGDRKTKITNVNKVMIFQRNLAVIAGFAGVTVVGVTALTLISGGRFDTNWSKDGGSLTIEGKPSLVNEPPIDK